MHIRTLVLLALALLMAPSCAPQPALQLVLSPSEPTTADTLLASIETEFGEPAEGTFGFRWYQDETEIGELSGLSLVPSAQTSRNQIWQVVATVTRGNSDPIELQSNTVEVVNSPPSIVSVEIAPVEATAATTLTAAVVGYQDIDGDGPIYSYLWTVDGASVGEDLATLETGLFIRGQVVQVQVTPSDGETEGEALLSESLTIGNAAPSAASIAILPVHPVGASDALQCALLESSVDVDADPVSYQLSWLSDGVTYPGDPIGSGWAGPASTALDDDTVPWADSFAGEEWTCMLSASDGMAVTESSYSVVLADSDQTVSDFSLMDVNTLSPTSGEPVSPRDYLCKVSGWYFGHST
jgi:hypothetical protein